ncbi:GntR family transcriptional regulator [uncultured Shimia sp.]|uniref:GntR family transcriptional regulator n=1 Tax=uncultured Shimia sp. TaxID=573152 RepID=UPI00261BFFC0|nr:GntR family transcriptional regulator [uncultured Shimia sp.]
MTTPAANLSYRDIKRIVLERIKNRTWLPDSLLPNETDLAAEFSSTRTTVNRALRELAEEGYLERKRKTGTRVLNAPVRHARIAISLTRDEITATGAAYRYYLISSKRQSGPEWLAARLNLKQSPDVLHLKCMHYADNKPFQFEDRWIVIDSVPGVLDADFSEIGPNEWLVQAVPFTNVELTFQATRATPYVTEFLNAEQDEPLFTAERVTWLQGRPVTFARMHFHPGYRMVTQY